VPQTMHIGVTQTESSKCVLNFILSKLARPRVYPLNTVKQIAPKSQIVGILLVDLGLGTQN